MNQRTAPLSDHRVSPVVSVSSLVPRRRPSTLRSQTDSGHSIRYDEASIETHQFETVDVGVALYKRLDVPIFHEFRYDFVLLTPRFGNHRRTNKRKDIRVVEVFPDNDLLAKFLYDVNVNVNPQLPHWNRMTDPCDIPFLSLAIDSKETQHFDNDLLVVVPSDPNFRVSATAVYGFILMAGDAYRVWNNAMPPTDSSQVAGARRSIIFFQFTCSQNLSPVGQW